MYMKFVVKTDKALTSSMYSGSEAEASQRLFRMKMLGFESRSLTLWKKCFSFEEANTEEGQKAWTLNIYCSNSAVEKINSSTIHTQTHNMRVACAACLSWAESESHDWIIKHKLNSYSQNRQIILLPRRLHRTKQYLAETLNSGEYQRTKNIY